MTPPTTFVAALVRALRGHGGRPSSTAPGAPSWGAVAAEARDLALGLRACGVGEGTVLRVGPPAGGPAVRVGRGLAVLSVGAALDHGARSEPHAILGDDGFHLEGAPTMAVADVLASGRAADAEVPAAYEEALAAVGSDAAALVAGDVTVTHDQLQWALRAVERWLLAAVGPWGPGRVLAVTAEEGDAALAGGLVGRWWPAAAGGQLVVTGGPGSPLSPSSLRDARPDLVVADAAAWAEVAAAVRDGADRTRRGRALLRHGRVAAADEPQGPTERALTRALARRGGPSLRAGAGVGRLELGLSLGVPDTATGRDLAAAGVPVVPTWVDAHLPAPVAAGPVVHAVASGPWGRPLPGRSVSCGGPTTTVSGGDAPGGEVVLAVRVETDVRARVRLP